MKRDFDTFFTADTHFGHANIIKYCPRSRGRFASVEEMDEGLIEAWNARVGERDLVYHLGDVAFEGAARAVEILRRLNGYKVLIVGNHDGRLLKRKEFRDEFVQIASRIELMLDCGATVTLSHEPLPAWDTDFHLFGHEHGQGAVAHGSLDVGVDTREDVAPWTWQEIEAKINSLSKC